MIVAVPTTIENAYWQAVADLLNTSPPAKMRIYSGSMPSPPGSAVGSQVLIAEFTLSDPVQTGIANGRIDFGAVSPATVLSAVTIGWVRLVAGDGAWGADLDAGLTGQNYAVTFGELSYPVGSLLAPTNFYLTFP